MRQKLAVKALVFITVILLSPVAVWGNGKPNRKSRPQPKLEVFKAEKESALTVIVTNDGSPVLDATVELEWVTASDEVNRKIRKTGSGGKCIFPNAPSGQVKIRAEVGQNVTELKGFELSAGANTVLVALPKAVLPSSSAQTFRTEESAGPAIPPKPIVEVTPVAATPARAVARVKRKVLAPSVPISVAEAEPSRTAATMVQPQPAPPQTPSGAIAKITMNDISEGGDTIEIQAYDANGDRIDSSTLSEGDFDVTVNGKVVTPKGFGNGVFVLDAPLADNALVVVTHRQTSVNRNGAVKPKAGGNLVGLIHGGIVLSQQADNFSQADPFFGFTVGYVSRQLGGGKAFNPRFNIRFQGVFTASGRAASAPEAGGENQAPDPATGFKAFLASRKTFDTEIQSWFEFPISPKVGIGPYAAIGASAILSRTELQGEAVNSQNSETTTGKPLDTGKVRTDNDLKKYYETGMIFTLHLPDRLFLRNVLAYGNYEAFDGLVEGKNTRRRFIGKLTVFPEGLKFRLGEQVEATPMFGVDLNAGRGPDQLRFYTGYTIQLKKFF